MRSQILNRRSLIALGLVAGLVGSLSACATVDRAAKRQDEIKKTQEEFSWWPTDAKPAPVKDEERGGYWWWPEQKGTSTSPLWGNRGYVYVYKVIFDYKADELPPPQPQEMRASLVIKKIVKNVKIYFDYDSASIREDAAKILGAAVATLKRNPETDILITGNCDIRGTEAYNEKLGRRRADSVREFILDKGVPEERVRIVSRGKLDAIAPVTDLMGMAKDRNAQFMIAEVEEVMIPYEGQAAGGDSVVRETADGKKVIEEKEVLENKIQVETKEYTIQKGDTLWVIAAKELGSGHRWKYLYELNKDRIKNADKLKVGTKIVIPIE